MTAARYDFSDLTLDDLWLEISACRAWLFDAGNGNNPHATDEERAAVKRDRDAYQAEYDRRATVAA